MASKRAKLPSKNAAIDYAVCSFTYFIAKDVDPSVAFEGEE